MRKPFSSMMQQAVQGNDVLVSGMTLDSRQVQQGDVFFAVKGLASDGHRYIQQAVNAGAVAVALEDVNYAPSADVSYSVDAGLKSHLGDIAARFYDMPSQQMAVTGITGTNGKTSVASYVAQLLTVLGKGCGEIGTLGIRYGDHEIETPNTTPDAITLQKHFYQMQQAGVEAVAMEVSSHAMAQQRCQGTQFDTVVFTNLSHDHLDYHGDFATYRKAKQSLFMLPGIRCAVVNLDDENGHAFADVTKADRVVSFSLTNTAADYSLADIQRNEQGYQAELLHQGEAYPLKVNLLGAFNVSNVLAAIAAVHQQGFELRAVVDACASLRTVAGRMQTIANAHGVTAVVDYAHTPDALQQVLNNLRLHTEGQLIVVFGCGGDRDKEKRSVMAQIAEAVADVQIVTADNPRSESVNEINQQIVSGFSSDAYVLIADRQQAIEKAVAMAKPGDCVLVAGKGHETYQQLADRCIDFDDSKVLADALASKELA